MLAQVVTEAVANAVVVVEAPAAELAGAVDKEAVMGTKEHNQGQTDVANGEYNRPVSHADEVFTWTSSGVRDVTEKLSDYQAGRDHAKGQK